MTNEELQRAIEFIVEQEARSSAKIDAIAEAQNRAEERWVRTEEGIRALLAIAEMHEKEIQANSQQISSVSRDVRVLSETTRATDDRLNALINVVEQVINERQNGKT